MESADLRGILEELLGKAAVVQRTSGYVVNGLSLKTQQASHAAVI